MEPKITIKEVEAMGSDSIAVFGGTFEGGINLQQVPDEIVPCINDIIKSKHKIENFLEIGSAAGGSSVLFNNVFKIINTIIIDDNQHPRHILRPDNLRGIWSNIKEFIGKSQSADAVKFIKKLKLKFDIVLIDGDHNFSAVMWDFETYSKFLNPGGFIILHDTHIVPGVEMAFDKIKEDKKYKVTSYLSKTHRPCGIGLLQRK